MLPGINMNQIKKMMKDVENIGADRVVIELSDGGKMIVSHPQVMRMNIMGSDSFQITGEVSEESSEPFSEEDVHVVMEQAGVDAESAKAKLIENDGDIAKTIIDLKK